MIPLGRTTKILLFILVCLGAGYFYRKHLVWLPRAAYLTGWLLLLLMLALTLYNARKKIPFLPLLTSRAWLQFHAYAGWFTLLLFLAHIRFRMPTGWFEGSLALLYGSVMVSGIVGLYISRSFPRRLTARGSEVIYEQIPVIRRRLQERAEALALGSIPAVQAATLAEFYMRDLAGYFSGPKHFWSHLLEIPRPLQRLQGKVEDLNRFLNEKERATLAEIAELVRQKDGLDYHHALQLTLKLWLFTHIPLTYSLLLFSLLHVVLIYAFSGGA